MPEQSPETPKPPRAKRPHRARTVNPNQSTTRRERIFAAEYCIDQNGARSAIAAGYSVKTAKEAGSELLTRPNVRRMVDEILTKKLAKADVNAQMVIDGLRALATFDLRRLYNEDGTLKQPNELDDETQKAVAGFEVRELFIDGDEKGCVGQIRKYKLLDRGQNLERLGRTMALFIDKVRHEGLEGLADGLRERRKAMNA